MKNCQNYQILNLIYPALDRLNEAAFYIRLMEANYHYSDKFRWSLNSFLRTLVEIPQILQMQIQNNKEVNDWFRKERSYLFQNDELIGFCKDKRNDIVHKEMLIPNSQVAVGFTRGKGLKLGMSWPANPSEDSEMAILKYINFSINDENGDFLGILYQEDDGSGEYTCVERIWRLDKFPNSELTELAASAWNKVADLLQQTAKKLNAELVDLEFELESIYNVRYQIYPPSWIKEQIELAKHRNQTI